MQVVKMGIKTRTNPHNQPRNPQSITSTPTQLCPPYPPLSTPLQLARTVTHGLIRKRRRHAGHNNIKRSTNVNRHRRRRVRPSSDTRTHDTHDPVQADRNAVAGAAVGRR
jgi:hypothetical protein